MSLPVVVAQAMYSPRNLNVACYNLFFLSISNSLWIAFLFTIRKSFERERTRRVSTKPSKLRTKGIRKKTKSNSTFIFSVFCAYYLYILRLFVTSNSTATTKNVFIFYTICILCLSMTNSHTQPRHYAYKWCACAQIKWQNQSRTQFVKLECAKVLSVSPRMLSENALWQNKVTRRGKRSIFSVSARECEILFRRGREHTRNKARMLCVDVIQHKAIKRRHTYGEKKWSKKLQHKHTSHWQPKNNQEIK